MNQDVIKLAQNLFFDRAIDKKSKKYYVPTFHEQTEELRDEIFFSEIENHSFYIAGQSGTGKTSALNFLPDKKILDKFTPIYINYRDLLAFDDADIIDILLMFAYKLSEKDKKISKKFLSEIEKIDKVHNKNLEIEKEKETSKNTKGGNESNVGGGISFLSLFKASSDFFASFTMDKQVRKITREFFTLKKIDLLKLVNKIIENWYEINGTTKKLLVFFDDFDKLRNYEQIRSIFVDNRNFLEQINCKKIISIPVHLATDTGFNLPTTKLIVFTIKLRVNPLTRYSVEKQKIIIKKNEDNLIKIIRKRDSKKLIELRAIRKAIEYSGGILRQFVQLLGEATVFVRRYGGDKVKVADVEKAIDAKRLQLSLTITGQDIELYKNVMETYKQSTLNNDKFIYSLLNSRILMHPNDEYWYDLNPLIKKSVETYSKDKFKLEK